MPLTLPHVPGLDVVRHGRGGRPGRHPPRGRRPGRRLPALRRRRRLRRARRRTRRVPSPSPPRRIPLADAAALPIVGLTAWQALTEHAGSRRDSGSWSTAPAAPWPLTPSSWRRRSAPTSSPPPARAAPSRSARPGADEVVDHTATDVGSRCHRARRRAAQPRSDHARGVLRGWPASSPTAASWSARTRLRCPHPPTSLAACAGSTSTSAATPTSSPSSLPASTPVSCGSDVGERVSLDEVPDVHARAAAGTLIGKVVVVVDGRLMPQTRPRRIRRQ